MFEAAQRHGLRVKMIVVTHAHIDHVGGAAALETTWIEAVEDVDLDDLNPESLYKFRIKGFGPLLVAMDSHGGSLYATVNAEAARRRQAVLPILRSTALLEVAASASRITPRPCATVMAVVTFLPK